MEEYNLEEVHSTADEESNDGKDKFYEAQDDTTDSQRAAMQQISFEFSFQVGKLQASLFKSGANGTEEKALADATLEGFGLTFALRKYDMSVDVFLRDVTLAMIEQGKPKRPLLSSVAEHEDALVKVRYQKVQKDSPEYMTKHDGVDQSVDAELSTFGITVAPEPILALNDFIMTTFVPQDQPQQEKKEAPVQQSADKIRVRVRLTSAQGE
jgi:vacuolar protein sorting-associated protein 13A/C